MAQENINELITAYIDGEITDPSKVNNIKGLIEKDRSLKFDYQVQLLMKSIVTDRFKIQPTPEKVRRKVLRKINPSKNLLMAFFSRRLS
jgi:Txe/YoeB family toxin of Txe-Axe toxin-antitoxin module